MGYGAVLAEGWQLYVDYAATSAQTQVTTTHMAMGQQQSQAIALSTGAWKAPPLLFRVAGGFVLQLETATGTVFVQIQPGQLQAIAALPDGTGANRVPLEQRNGPVPGAMPPLSPLPPLSSMQPGRMSMGNMSMGNMSMNLDGMQMRMGDMELTMGDRTAPNPLRKFCPQCGNAVQVGNRFCAHCGHRLGEQNA